MKKNLSLFLLLAVCTAVLAQSDNVSEQTIIAGKGWGKICLGANIKTVEDVLGEGENRSQYDDVYFKDYPAKGIQISYNNSDNTVHTVYFYNGQRRYENFSSAQAKTDKGVDWKSTPKDVLKAYGKPKGNYEGPGWQRIVFEGIDFRFENKVMVRIGIPGN